MKRSKRYFPYILLLLLFCLLIFLNRSFFYNNLVDPITRILWLIVRLFLTFDQEVVWTFLIIIVITLGLIMIPSQQENYVQSAYSNASQINDRAAFWQLQFRSADNDTVNRLSLQQNLEGLHRSVHELVGGDEGKEIILPIPKTTTWQLITVKLKNLFDRIPTKRKKYRDSELESTINQILESMETLMEIQNDQSSSNSKNC